MKTVNRLVSSPGDGYLLRTSKGGKYETKSKGLGNQFSVFKAELGFDKRCVFHSIRKAVVTTLERADVKNLVIISLVGHKADGLLRMTFDRYSEGPTPPAKLKAVENLKYKFQSKFHAGVRIFPCGSIVMAYRFSLSGKEER